MLSCRIHRADYFTFPAWASFYFVGKAGDNPRARDTGRIGIEALIDSEITVNALKLMHSPVQPWDGWRLMSASVLVLHANLDGSIGREVYLLSSRQYIEEDRATCAEESQPYADRRDHSSCNSCRYA
jgi:hypothetical protein